MSEAILHTTSNVVALPVRGVPAPYLPPPIPVAVRRELFGGFASLLLLIPTEAGAGKVAELDGELLACCRKAEAASGQAAFVMDGLELLDPDDPATTRSLEAACPLVFAYRDALDRAAQLPARTPEGLRAKAGLLLLHLGGDPDHDALAASLARDVAGRA